MTSAFLAILASSTSLFEPVQPTNPVTWVTNSDFPEKFRESGGLVGFVVAVDPSGKPVRCEVTSSSGEPELDRYTCTLVMVRSSFKAAHDEGGKAVYGVYSGRFKWAGSKSSPLVVKPDVELSVTRMPKTGSSKFLQVWLLFNETGSPVACRIANDVREKALEAPICKVLMAMSNLPRVIDGHGKNVRGVRSLSIGFVSDEYLPPERR